MNAVVGFPSEFKPKRALLVCPESDERVIGAVRVDAVLRGLQIAAPTP